MEIHKAMHTTPIGSRGVLPPGSKDDDDRKYPGIYILRPRSQPPGRMLLKFG
jgi:hypothetical protein